MNKTNSRRNVNGSLTEFIEHRAKEAEAFEAHQQRELQKIRQQLDSIGENL